MQKPRKVGDIVRYPTEVSCVVARYVSDGMTIPLGIIASHTPYRVNHRLGKLAYLNH